MSQLNAQVLPEDPDTGKVYPSANIAGDSKVIGLLDVIGNTRGPPSLSAGSDIRVRAQTYTDNVTAASGTATGFSGNSFGIPTLAAANTSVTTTNAATVYIAGAPAAGTNQTLTNAYALLVDAGVSRLDAGVQMDKTNVSGAAGTLVANGRCGKISVTGLTTAAGATSATITWENSSVLATSVIHLTVEGPGGAPHVNIIAQSAGSTTLAITNGHASAALSGTQVINYLVL